MDLEARESESRKDSKKDSTRETTSDLDFNFDFKPLNEGLGFHRKVKPLEAESDPEDSFSFSAIGSGTLGVTLDVASREQSKGLLSSSTLSTAAAAGGKSKHNAKSVSDLIAALPPSLDLLLDEKAAPASTAKSPSAKLGGLLGAQAAAASTAGSRTRRSPLFGPPSDEFAKPGSPAAASMNAAASTPTAGEKSADKRGFLKLPLGRNDYGLKSKGTSATPSSLDENVAKTFPSVFPHLGNLAGQPAAATIKATLKSGALETATAGYTAKSTATELRRETTKEHAISAHFGSAVLDTLVSIGIACLMLAIALSITGANLLALLENSATDEAMMVSLAAFFVGCGLLYVLAARTWVGATLGEWSYEVRVGDEKSRTRWFYPVLVLWRGVLVAATGFVVLPLISMIAGTDVLKFLTGLQLVSMNASPDMALEGSLVVENPA